MIANIASKAPSFLYTTATARAHNYVEPWSRGAAITFNHAPLHTRVSLGRVSIEFPARGRR